MYGVLLVNALVVKFGSLTPSFVKIVVCLMADPHGFKSLPLQRLSNNRIVTR